MSVVVLDSGGLSALADRIIRLRSDGTVIGFSPGATPPYLWQADQVLGRNAFTELLPQDVVSEVQRNVSAVSRDGIPRRQEYTLRTAKGAYDYAARYVRSGDDEVTAILRRSDGTKARDTRFAGRSPGPLSRRPSGSASSP